MSENQLVVRRYFQDVVSQAGIDVIDGPALRTTSNTIRFGPEGG